MANVNIPSAKRLNPRGRKIGGGDTLDSLGFKKLSNAGISGSGKIVIKELDTLRDKIVKDANLVIAIGADTTATTAELVAEYITELKEILTEFQSTPADIDETNADGQAAIDEMINLKSELTSIKTYCKINAAIEPSAEDIIPVQKLKAQNFPKFDGTDDGTTFLIWKDQIRKIMPKLRPR